MRTLPFDPASLTSDPVRMGIKRHSRCSSNTSAGHRFAWRRQVLTSTNMTFKAMQSARAKHTPDDDHDADTRTLPHRQLEMDVWAYNEVRRDPSLLSSPATRGLSCSASCCLRPWV